MVIFILVAITIYAILPFIHLAYIFRQNMNNILKKTIQWSTNCLNNWIDFRSQSRLHCTLSPETCIIFKGRWGKEGRGYGDRNGTDFKVTPYALSTLAFKLEKRLKLPRRLGDLHRGQHHHHNQWHHRQQQPHHQRHLRYNVFKCKVLQGVGCRGNGRTGGAFWMVSLCSGSMEGDFQGLVPQDVWLTGRLTSWLAGWLGIHISDQHVDLVVLVPSVFVKVWGVLVAVQLRTEDKGGMLWGWIPVGVVPMQTLLCPWVTEDKVEVRGILVYRLGFGHWRLVQHRSRFETLAAILSSRYHGVGVQVV